MKNYMGYFAGVDRDPDSECGFLLFYSLDKQRKKDYSKELTEKGK